MKILIFGLPNSGKTTLAQQLTQSLPSCTWFNADVIRAQYNDWDFSLQGRRRQAGRMRELAGLATTDHVICDFVAPTVELRTIFGADRSIWMNTVRCSSYADTNALFEPPGSVDLEIKDFNYSIDSIVQSLYNEIP